MLFLTNKITADDIPGGVGSGINYESFYLFLVIFLFIFCLVMIFYMIYLNSKIDNLKQYIEEYNVDKGNTKK